MMKKEPSESNKDSHVIIRMASLPVVAITCGNVRGRLHKNKFYCPGIHRECIEYQGKFITPKMFSIMGDKEKLKDWKNAIRINGSQIRKYIESGTLDFFRHDEFCTGRCIARSPVNRLNSSQPDPKVEFVSSINEHTYCHLPNDGTPVLAGMGIPTIQLKGEPEPVDVKPNVALLQSLLEKPPTSTVNVLPADVAEAFSSRRDVDTTPLQIDPQTAEEDRQFWVGILELGLLEHFFKEIKINLDVFKSDLVVHQVRTTDAVRISSVVRSMGLMTKFKKRLALFKADMEQQQAKLDAEMESLKQQVNAFELRKQALKRKAEKFEALMDMSQTSNSKKAFIIEKNIDNSDGGDSEEETEVADVCYENAEDDDDEEGQVEVDDKQPGIGEKKITIPIKAKIVDASSPLFKTLPADSNSSYLIQNNQSALKTISVATVQAGTQSTSSFAALQAAIQPASSSQGQSKGGMLIRKVLMDTTDPIETMKQAMNQKQSTISSTSTSNDPKPKKEKIKIIARCKPVMDKNMSSANRSTPPTGIFVCSKPDPNSPIVISHISPVTQKETKLVPSTETTESVPVQTVNSEAQSKSPKTSPITKDLKVVVQPVKVKKRRPGPKSKTEYYEVEMSPSKGSKDDNSNLSLDNVCEVPIDGGKENSNSSDKVVTSTRRSSRKTVHMFSWGKKLGSDIVDEPSAMTFTDEEVVINETVDTDMADFESIEPISIPDDDEENDGDEAVAVACVGEQDNADPVTVAENELEMECVTFEEVNEDGIEL